MGSQTPTPIPVPNNNQANPIPVDYADLTQRQTADAAAAAAEEVIDYSQDTKLKNTSFAQSAALIAQDLSGDLSPDLVAWIKKRSDGGEDALLGENETLADTLNDIGIQFGSAAEGAVNCELDKDIMALNNKVLNATDTTDEVAAVQQLVQLYDYDVIPGLTSTTGLQGAINFILTDDVVADQVSEGNYTILASALLTYAPGLLSGLPTPNPTGIPPIPSFVNQIIAIVKQNVSTLKDYDNKHGIGDGGSRDQDYVLDIATLASALAAAATPAPRALTISINPTTTTPAPDGTYSITPSFNAATSTLSFSVPPTALVSVTDSNPTSIIHVTNTNGLISITGAAALDMLHISVDDGILPATYTVQVPQSIESVGLGGFSPDRVVSADLVLGTAAPVFQFQFGNNLPLSAVTLNGKTLTLGMGYTTVIGRKFDQVNIPLTFGDKVTITVNGITYTSAVPARSSTVTTLPASADGYSLSASGLQGISANGQSLQGSINVSFPNTNLNSLIHIYATDISTPSPLTLTASLGPQITNQNIITNTYTLVDSNNKPPNPGDTIVFTDVDGPNSLQYTYTVPVPEPVEAQQYLPLSQSFTSVDGNYSLIPTFNNGQFALRTSPPGVTASFASISTMDMSVSPPLTLTPTLINGAYRYPNVPAGDTLLISIDDHTSISTYQVGPLENPPGTAVASALTSLENAPATVTLPNVGTWSDQVLAAAAVISTAVAPYLTGPPNGLNEFNILKSLQNGTIASVNAAEIALEGIFGLAAGILAVTPLPTQETPTVPVPIPFDQFTPSIATISPGVSYYGISPHFDGTYLTAQVVFASQTEPNSLVNDSIVTVNGMTTTLSALSGPPGISIPAGTTAIITIDDGISIESYSVAIPLPPIPAQTIANQLTALEGSSATYTVGNIFSDQIIAATALIKSELLLYQTQTPSDTSIGNILENVQLGNVNVNFAEGKLNTAFGVLGLDITPVPILENPATAPLLITTSSTDTFIPLSGPPSVAYYTITPQFDGTYLTGQIAFAVPYQPNSLGNHSIVTVNGALVNGLVTLDSQGNFKIRATAGTTPVITIDDGISIESYSVTLPQPLALGVTTSNTLSKFDITPTLEPASAGPTINFQLPGINQIPPPEITVYINGTATSNYTYVPSGSIGGPPIPGSGLFVPCPFGDVVTIGINVNDGNGVSTYSIGLPAVSSTVAFPAVGSSISNPVGYSIGLASTPIGTINLTSTIFPLFIYGYDTNTGVSSSFQFVGGTAYALSPPPAANDPVVLTVFDGTTAISYTYTQPSTMVQQVAALFPNDSYVPPTSDPSIIHIANLITSNANVTSLADFKAGLAASAVAGNTGLTAANYDTDFTNYLADPSAFNNSFANYYINFGPA